VSLLFAFGEGSDVLILRMVRGIGLAFGEASDVLILRMVLGIGLAFGEASDVLILRMVRGIGLALSEGPGVMRGVILLVRVRQCVSYVWVGCVNNSAGIVYRYEHFGPGLQAGSPLRYRRAELPARRFSMTPTVSYPRRS
jgi:hypothetical protein